MFDNLHTYEIMGNFLFRRPGNDVRHIMQCTAIRTQVGPIERLEDNHVLVGISLVTTGFQQLLFNTWFTDWIYPTSRDPDSDAMSFPPNEYQATYGRHIIVAVETNRLNQMIETGHWIDGHWIDAVNGEITDPDTTPQRYRPYSSPVVAAFINSQWMEPMGFGNGHLPVTDLAPR